MADKYRHDPPDPLTASWTRLTAWLAPAEISLGRLLLLALACRIPAVFFARGFEYLDHQFQYVDPAYHVAFDASWWRPFDYVDGHRSWVYPQFLAGVFRLIDTVGIHEAGAMMTATRFVHALISLLPVAAFWQLVVRWKGLTGQRPLLIAFACNPILVMVSVQPTGLALGSALALTAIFLFHGPGFRWPLLSGLAIGLAFACRFQDSLFGFVLFGAGAVQRRWGACAALSAGALVAIALQGVVDVATWGSFLHSPIRYWKTNVGGEAARFTEPFWYFFAIAAGICLAFPPFLRSAGQALRSGSKVFPILIAAALLYLLVHSAIPRKSFRFVWPALILLMTVMSSGLLPRTPDETALRTWHRRLFLGVQILGLAFWSLHYPNRGPVEAARALSRLPDFQDRLLIVGAGHDSTGGHYYMRRDRLEQVAVAGEGLTTWLRENAATSPVYAMSVEEPLDQSLVPSSWTCTPIGRYADWPDGRRGARRWLYRFERAGEPPNSGR